MSASVSTHVNTSHFGLEVVRKMGFFKMHKAARPGRLSLSFFKEGEELLTSELPKPLVTNWKSEEIDKNWCDSLIAPIYKKGDGSPCVS